MRMHRKPPLRRRGVLLLVILGLLAMFGLVAVAFVVVAGQAQRAARTVQRVDQSYDPPQQTLQQAANILLVGSNNPQSAVQATGLLEGIYGNEWLRGEIAGLDFTICGQQLFEFNAIDAPSPAHTGCVLTMLNGRLAGQSTHIVSTNAAGTKYQARAFEGGMPANGDMYLINGAPFSGMGFGYNPQSGRLDAMNGSWPIALLPNTPLPVTNGVTGNPPGGANGDYNAPDYQTPLLGAVVYNPATGAAYVDNAGKPLSIIPSLHRPDLIAYWRQKVTGFDTNADLMRLVMFRPNPIDHPAFPRLSDLIYGPWDVDNDGDGVPDSVWVDLGFPVRTAPDGRKYKPMVAVLCVDMDGRLNVNAHGSIWQTEPTYYPEQQPIITRDESPLAAAAFAGTMNVNQAIPLPRGQGYGPADINLLPLFQTDAAAMARYRAVLTGIYDKGLEGRYGELARVQGGGVAGPGFSGVLDFLTANKLFQYAPARPPYTATYWDFFTGVAGLQLDAFGAPPDISGTGAVALDLAGRPLYLDYLYQKKDAAGKNMAFGPVDNPYEINLSQNAPRGMPYPMAALPDNPYSVAELERILRPFDKDSATLPGRLFQLTTPDGASFSALQAERHAVTTESWSVPTPSPAMPLRMRLNSGLGNNRGHHVTDLLRAAGVSDPAVWRRLLPPEMLSGCKLDLSRPLGNGRDNNGNDVVNEPSEAYANNGVGQQKLPLYNGAGGSSAEYLFTFFTADQLNVTPQQMQARYLYVLAMLLCDLQYLDDDTKLPPIAGLTGRPKTCRFLAQWAANVVDFCDRDSIMTKFEYPVYTGNPPNMSAGWNPTHVVWGCERPELLFGEAIAFHDRRTEDLEFKNADDTDNKKTDDPKEPDKDFDQGYRPQGSFFFELINPQSPFDPPAGEFYTKDATKGKYVVRLNARTPVGNDPVWRVVVATIEQLGAEEQPDPDDPATPATLIKRSIYFVNPGGSKGNDGRQQYYPGTPRDVGIEPGGYAVVGSAEKGNAKKQTYLGFETGKTTYADTTRHITLNPTDISASKPSVVRNNSDAGTFVSPPEVLAIDSPRRLSLTEPTDGYEPLEAALPDNLESTTDPVKYKIPYDQPFDKRTDPDTNEEMWGLVGGDKSTTAFRMLHLQRLADPTRAYDANTNPYLTIDSMPVDLTAFNGLTGKKDPSEAAGGEIHFESRQRGETTEKYTQGPADAYDLWKQEMVDKNFHMATPPPIPGHIFDKKLLHSLGFLSRPMYGSPIVGGLAAGGPQVPFAWFTWNNRPFTSPLELMLVPAYSSSKILCRPRSDTGTVPTARRYYNFVKLMQPAGKDPYAGGSGTPYTHLLNFFQSGLAGDVAGLAAPSFFRILDYVHIPSHFAGTEVQINPTLAANSPGQPFQPPFNGIPTYREPGRINLNTIFCQEVFTGLMNYYPGSTTAAFWAKFVQSRRGDSVADIFAINAAMPSRFGRPFRTFGGADLVPPGVPPTVPPMREVDATLLRSDPADPTRPLFGNDSTKPYADTNRNPYFRYQSLSRLGNLVTTHSNVFAVWITVGYFEVTPFAVDPGHPDGYRLGQELGSDTGNIERHRAFYIIDRTIPVAFQRGKDYNAQNAILLKRVIE